MTTQSRLITVKEWPIIHSWPTESGLRHLIHKANDNGFHTVIKRIGKRILIDETKFFEWVKLKQEDNKE